MLIYIYPKRLDEVAVDGHLEIITFMSSILANWLYPRFTGGCRGLRLIRGRMGLDSLTGARRQRVTSRLYLDLFSIVESEGVRSTVHSRFLRFIFDTFGTDGSVQHYVLDFYDSFSVRSVRIISFDDTL
jgi:hypothetical protein